MAYRNISARTLCNVLAFWKSGHGLKRIARATGLDRKTVRRYVRVAERCVDARRGALDRGALNSQDLAALVVKSLLEGRERQPTKQALLQRWHGRICDTLDRCSNLTRAHAELRALGLDASYATFRRYVVQQFKCYASPARRKRRPPPA